MKVAYETFTTSCSSLLLMTKEDKIGYATQLGYLLGERKCEIGVGKNAVDEAIKDIGSTSTFSCQ